MATKLEVMWVFETQMHLVTFLFICLETLILFYLIMHKLARPNDSTTSLDITLITLLLVYNITGGLLPDPNLPGSFYVQESIAYGTGFITPCYFPYYVYKGFALKKMKFHAFRGVLYFLIVPYVLFLVVFGVSGMLQNAKYILVVPVLYGLWVLHSVYKSIQFKYQNKISAREANEELIVLFFSLTPWIGLPFIAYFDLSQAIEAPTTNFGFLVLFALHLKRTIKQLKVEHKRLMEAELLISNGPHLRSRQLLSEKPTDPEINGSIPLAQEGTNTQLHLIKSYLELQSENKFEKNCTEYNLTTRERDIARYICQGYMYKAIAQNLHISDRTVTTHVQNIFKKLKVGNKLELINMLMK